jgi:thiosulfate/3-mercaptopyruvate sulfurtransferase
VIDPVVTTAWLRRRRGAVVLDGRWYHDGGGAKGRAAYKQGHLPRARFVDLDRCEAGPPSAAAGRHPLPTPAAFATCCSALGILPTSTVVVYDDTGGMAAARMVWMLRALDVDAAVLDGGIGAWSGDLETGSGGLLMATTFPVRPWPPELLAVADELLDAPLVIDARAAERYRGDVEPIDSQAGHIPGAVNVPFTANVDADGSWLPAHELRARFEAAGVRRDEDVVVYCGSGVTACHDLLAIERAGLGRGRLYPGSWSQWSADPDRPVATGDE